jgi:23S rRNA (uridine2552-2'-O)-methyltransferase
MKNGFVIGVDRDYIEPIDGAHLLSYSNIESEKVIKNILDLVKNKPVSTVISDMAPNASGEKCLDHEAIIELQLKALNLAKQCLKQDGIFLCKIWNGDCLPEFKDTLKKNFETINTLKPLASRTDSSEIFVLALKFKTSFKS